MRTYCPSCSSTQPLSDDPPLGSAFFGCLACFVGGSCGMPATGKLNNIKPFSRNSGVTRRCIPASFPGTVAFLVPIDTTVRNIVLNASKCPTSLRGVPFAVYGYREQSQDLRGNVYYQEK